MQSDHGDAIEMIEDRPDRPDSAPASATVPAIRVSGLEYSYPDGKAALRGVDLSIEVGESVALVGPNGAGKSTLLLHLNGLLPGKPRHDRSQSCDRRFRGWPCPSAEHLDRGRGGESPQRARRAETCRARVPGPRRSALLQHGRRGCRVRAAQPGDAPAEARQLAIECLARVDLEAAADRPPHHLSFGERKRVCLAGVLACRPSVLVLDEPSANLDPRARRRFIGLIRSLDCTKLIATHDLEMALELCPRTILLDVGRVVADGPSREILGNADLMDSHGLEQPLSLRMGLSWTGSSS